MKVAGKLLLMGLLAMAATGQAKEPPEMWALQTGANVRLKCADDFTITLRGAGHFGNQFEQLGEYFFVYEQQGHTSDEGAVGFEVNIGKLGNLDVTGGGEMFLRGRVTEDSTALKDHVEVAPTGIINLALPFAGGFKAEFLNRLERRIFRGPGDVVTHLRYNAQTRLSTCEFTPLRIAGYVYYEGYVQKIANHMSGFGAGTSLQIIPGLKLDMAFSDLWTPNVKHSVVHQMNLTLAYSADFTKAK